MDLKNVFIEKILLNHDGVLCLVPKDHDFRMIYRSARGVHWDDANNWLFHNPPQEWEPIQWYRHILSAVKNEYGVILKVCLDTVYENIDDKLRKSIESEHAYWE